LITVYGLNVDAFKASKPRAFFEMMKRVQPDIIALQETGCEPNQMPEYAQLPGYNVEGNFGSESAGRTGVAILSKRPISTVLRNICDGVEHESCKGRFVEASVGNMRFVSVYAHAHDSTSAERKRARIQFYECLKQYMMRSYELPCLISLDANVALSREDVANDTQFSGPWASRTYRDPIVLAMESGRWVDSYRQIHGNKRRATVWIPGKFARELEMGYAVDFQLISKPISTTTVEAEVLKPSSWETRYSDHAPTFAKYLLDSETFAP
jgi:exodeoxyribonuclease-3